MSILYSESQSAIADAAHRILGARMKSGRLLELLERTGQYDTEFWNTVIDQGWAGVGISPAHGGVGLNLVELGLIAHAAGTATSGAPFIAPGYALSQLLANASRETQARFLPALASGRTKAAIAFGEGSAVLPSVPTVEYAGGKLTGVKRSVSAGLAADVALVWVRYKQATALVVVDLPGVARTPIDTADNSRLFADLEFAGSPATLLAEGTEARTVALNILARWAVVAAHEQTGGAEALMRTGCNYALSRRAFGQPIGAFQSVKHRLAELYAAIELARANCIHAASLEGRAGFILAAAAARLSATDAYDRAARDVTQIHGAIGVTWEAGLHLHMRRARSLAIECGNMFFWEDLLVEHLTGVAA